MQTLALYRCRVAVTERSCQHVKKPEVSTITINPQEYIGGWMYSKKIQVSILHHDIRRALAVLVEKLDVSSVVREVLFEVRTVRGKRELICWRSLVTLINNDTELFIVSYIVLSFGSYAFCSTYTPHCLLAALRRSPTEETPRAVRVGA